MEFKLRCHCGAYKAHHIFLIHPKAKVFIYTSNKIQQDLFLFAVHEDVCIGTVQ